MHGRDEREWEKMIAAGREILVARAVLDRTTSYGEFAAALIRRTGCARFDFASGNGRASMAYLLERISEAAYAESGEWLLGAVVRHPGVEDGGPWFCRMAVAKGFLVPRTRGGRQLFWAAHVRELHEHYAGRRRRSAG